MELTFYVAAAVAIVSTVLMLTRLNLVHALLYLIVSLLGVAVVFFVLGAPFAAALEASSTRAPSWSLPVRGDDAQHRAHSPKGKQWLTPGIWTGPAILSTILLVEVAYLAGGASAGLALAPSDRRKLEWRSSAPT
jgi:NADH-quinone oxidoreductase subunit J